MTGRFDDCRNASGIAWQAKLDKMRLLAPVDGTVGIIVAELGESLPY